MSKRASEQSLPNKSCSSPDRASERTSASEPSAEDVAWACHLFSLRHEPDGIPITLCSSHVPCIHTDVPDTIQFWILLLLVVLLLFFIFGGRGGVAGCSAVQCSALRLL